VPSWVGEKSNHGDELPFVFGSPYSKENSLEKGNKTSFSHLNINFKHRRFLL